MPNSLFHLQFPPPEMAMGIVHNILFESLDGFQVLTSGTGEVDLGSERVKLSSGTTGGGRAYLTKKVYYPSELYSFDKKRTFKVEVLIGMSPDSGPMVHIGCNSPLEFEPGAAFVFYDTKICGVTSDGSGFNSVDLITGLGPGYSELFDLKFIFNPGENVQFYINWILKGTSILNLPEGEEAAKNIFLARVENVEDQQHEMRFSQVRMDQDL